LSEIAPELEIAMAELDVFALTLDKLMPELEERDSAGEDVLCSLQAKKARAIVNRPEPNKTDFIKLLEKDVPCPER